MMAANQPQPGRELDEAIARALGWKCTPIYNDWISLEGKIRNCLPFFSTIDATALALLQQLCKPGEEGGRDFDGFTVWCSRDSRDNSIIYSVNLTEYIRDYGGQSGISFAHATALAVLAAPEAEKCN